MPAPAATQATKEWPSATPTLRSAVESDRSLCQRETASLRARWPSSAFATPRFPSEFSKSMGFTLCGMVELPVSPAAMRCLK